MPTHADLAEIFSGIQGEGLYVGQRQIFVRFAGCNLRCAYCDTPGAQTASRTFRVETQAGERVFAPRPNPVDEAGLLSLLRGLHASDPSHEAVSLTGGEPLLQADFLAGVGAQMREVGLALHLETNGVLPDALAQVIDWVDVVAMDIKLASATGQPDRFDDNRAFLAVAARREVFVKLVVAQMTQPDDVAEVGQFMADQSRDIPLVLQPVTQPGQQLDERMLLRLQSAAARHVRSVRVIPQVHKLTGCL